MSAAHLDIDLKLASGRPEITAPFKCTVPAVRRAPPIEAQPTAPEPPKAPAPREYISFRKLQNLLSSRTLHRLPRPSWLAVVAAVASVAAIVWWIMLQRLPDIDPRAVIATNLASAERALNDGRYVDPPERSAVHYYSAVLALDPANEDAMRGMDLIAERYLESAKTLLVNGRVADAVIALENVRRVRPDHRRLSLLDAQLGKELDRQVFSRTPAAEPLGDPQALSRAAKASPAASKEPRAAERDGTSETPTQPAVRDAAPALIARTDPTETDLNGAVPAQPTWLAALLATSPGISPSRTGADQSGANAGPGAQPTPQSGAGPGAAIDSARKTPPAASTAPAPAPNLVKYIEPDYPREALLRGIEGWVDLSLAISPSGDVIEPRIEDGKGRQLFDRPALAAVRQWKYEPRPGADPEQRTRVRVKFELKDSQDR